MIKEKEIYVNIVGRNVNKYHNLGYDCNVGDNVMIDIKHMTENSHVKITAICDNCGKETIISMYAYSKNYKKYNEYFCNDCKQIKIEKTNNIRYGVNRPLQNKLIRDKLESTNLKKYGFKIGSQNEEVKAKSKNKQFLLLLKKYGFLDIKNIEKGNCTIQCDKGHIFDINFSLLNLRLKYKTILCTICNPISSSKSGLELQLRDFIKEHCNHEIIFNSRSIISPLELDIYIPNLKLAFEYNGLYWHNNFNKDDNYHLNKMQLCLDKDIQLVHIWEDDWKYNSETIKSLILKLLNNEVLYDDDRIEIESFLVNNKLLEYYRITDYIESVKWNIDGDKRLKFDETSELSYLYDCGKIKLERI